MWEQADICVRSQTALKAAMSILGKIMGVCVIIVITTTTNRDEICDKLNGGYFKYLDLKFRPTCLTILKPKGFINENNDGQDYEKILEVCIRTYGTIVLNLSGFSVQKVRRMLMQVWDDNVNAATTNGGLAINVPFPSWALIKVFCLL